MFDTETTALLRRVLDEVCEDIPVYETGARAHVASKLLDAARRGERSADQLRRIGSIALSTAPIALWRRRDDAAFPANARLALGKRRNLVA